VVCNFFEYTDTVSYQSALLFKACCDFINLIFSPGNAVGNGVLWQCIEAHSSLTSRSGLLNLLGIGTEQVVAKVNVTTIVPFHIETILPKPR
jgi:hypothetical protein